MPLTRYTFVPLPLSGGSLGRDAGVGHARRYFFFFDFIAFFKPINNAAPSRGKTWCRSIMGLLSWKAKAALNLPSVFPCGRPEGKSRWVGIHNAPLRRVRQDRNLLSVPS